MFGGSREAAKALNKLVDVMGSQIDASLLIMKIEDDFGFRKAREAAFIQKQQRSHVEQLVQRFGCLSVPAKN